LKLSDEFMPEAPNSTVESSHASSGSGLGSEPGEPANAAAAGLAGGKNGNDKPAEKPELLEVLLAFVQEILASGSTVIEVYKDRMRTSVRRTVLRLALGVSVAVLAICWLGAAALAISRGVLGGFSALFDGRTWLGELTGGLFILTLTGITVALLLQLSARRELARLKAKYTGIRNARSS